MTMNFSFDDSPAFAERVKQKIAEFNWQHWQGVERLPLGLKLEDDQGQLLAGLSGRSFGNWLLLDNFWVDSSLRGQGIGERMLNQAECIARDRGCKWVLLDTLEFQARPFYQARGYRVEWTQEAYPSSGCKYFMVKAL
ncbi:GNAT family N-acetyltransferase [Shewanella salipaludis]|uniref:GNAT family N-acetyltransferase n=1 Tax=Shewanella salipaludis TaxID=2723052 RepID=A0A972JMZ1_9GAMM|nr:GNAT family N-acetyltransferase [Shewanella salipaludis]NMH67012.1 GNAT family N-acetyltransferase [Shewanella salipaludis]